MLFVYSVENEKLTAYINGVRVTERTKNILYKMRCKKKRKERDFIRIYLEWITEEYEKGNFIWPPDI